MAITKALQNSYKARGIKADAKRVYSPIGAILPLLKEGNSKTGKHVYTWSMLPTNKMFNTALGCVPGTCGHNCAGCYADTGFYKLPSTRDALAVNTLLAYNHLDFVNNAIRAQLDTLPGVDIRIHAAGDFFNKAYAEMWTNIARDYAGKNSFWTYTKTEYENIFDGIDGANIVKSILPGIGFNFGHIDYILDAYRKLVAAGEKPYICRCTFDKKQHCENCRGCIENKYVLFAEHSTAYKAEKDLLFSAAREIVDAQKDHEPAEIVAMINKAMQAETLPTAAK